MEIKGMEILKTTEITESYISPFLYAVIPFVGLIFIMFMLRGFVRSYDAEKLCVTCIWVLLFISTVIIALFVVDTNIWHKDERNVTRNEYEVQFDETVDIEEVRAHYEIVKKKGDIYILRDHLPVVVTCDSCDAVLEEGINYCPSCGAEVAKGGKK